MSQTLTKCMQVQSLVNQTDHKHNYFLFPKGYGKMMPTEEHLHQVLHCWSYFYFFIHKTVKS